MMGRIKLGLRHFVPNFSQAFCAPYCGVRCYKLKSEIDEIPFYYLFLDSVESHDGQLTITLSQAALSTQKEDLEIVEGSKISNLRAIEVQDKSLGYFIQFDDALYYQVIGESANDFSKDEIAENGNIITFKNSSLLNYLKESTFLFNVTPQDDQIVHYCVQTADDWIHVLSREKPTIVHRNT